MVKPALSDDILYTVEKPARYIGNEINMVKKKLEDIDIRFCKLIFYLLSIFDKNQSALNLINLNN